MTEQTEFTEEDFNVKPETLKEELARVFPDIQMYSTSSKLGDLYIVYTEGVWDYLKDKEVIGKTITTFIANGEWEGIKCIDVPFMG
jgi:hypothetical protein